MIFTELWSLLSFAYCLTIQQKHAASSLDQGPSRENAKKMIDVG